MVSRWQGGGLDSNGVEGGDGEEILPGGEGGERVERGHGGGAQDIGYSNSFEDLRAIFIYLYIMALIEIVTTMKTIIL